MKHSGATSPEENGPSGSTSPPSAAGVDFVKPEDLDYEMDCLLKGLRQAVERMRAKGLLPEQQEPKPKDK